MNAQQIFIAETAAPAAENITAQAQSIVKDAAAAAPADTAASVQVPAAPDAAAPQQQPGFLDGLMDMAPFLIIIVVMFYLMARSQKKEQKRRQDMIENIKKGDTILTTGGIYGEVAEIKDDHFVLQIAENVKISIAKAAVATVKGAGEDAQVTKK